jgi:small subunit ribosomal protein S1
MDDQKTNKPLDGEIENSENVVQGGEETVETAPKEEPVDAGPIEGAAEESVEIESVEEPTAEPKVEQVAETTQVEQKEETEQPKTLEELDALENEYSAQEHKELEALYEDTLTDFKTNQVVLGKVLAINDKEISVDIGFKSEGTIPSEEFTSLDEVIVGDNIEVYIDEIEDVDGYLVLSKKKADFMRIWAKVVESYETGEILTGVCTRRIKGGIVVDLGGVDAFLPGSQIDVRPIRDFDALIGNDMDFKIVKVNHLRKNIVVSHRVLVEEAMKGQRQKILEDLDRGQILEGIVKNITDFGVFIDLGGVDGLLHINDLSWGRVSHPSEVVALDEKIKVVVLDFNEDKNRISLGLKQLQSHPWEDVESKYPVETIVKGKVVSISDYGAFVELEKGVEGLIHISEMSWTQHIKHPSKILAVGESVEAKVLNIQKDERKISLGLKQLDPDPWETLSERYPVGSRHTGVVRNLTNFGAFVELEEGIDGLIHISDLSWTKKIRHPGEVVKKGDEIEVIVLNVDRDNRRISLGYKQTQENPWDVFESTYKNGTEIEGKVVRLIEKGLLAELPDGVDGFVPLSQLAKTGLTKPADGYQIDDTLKLTVIEFNKENKKIVLSEKGTPAPDDDIEVPMEELEGRVPSGSSASNRAESKPAMKKVAKADQEEAKEVIEETEAKKPTDDVEPEVAEVESEVAEVAEVTEVEAEVAKTETASSDEAPSETVPEIVAEEEADKEKAAATEPVDEIKDGDKETTEAPVVEEEPKESSDEGKSEGPSDEVKSEEK